MQRCSIRSALRTSRAYISALPSVQPRQIAAPTRVAHAPGLRRQLNLAHAPEASTQPSPSAEDRPETTVGATEVTQEPDAAQVEEGNGEAEAWWAEDGHPEAGEVPPSSFQLRPYQIDCVEACLSALREGGYNRIGVSSPTGASLSILATLTYNQVSSTDSPNSCPKFLLQEAEKLRSTLASRVLVIVGSIELARQARSTIERTWPELTVEIEQGSQNVASGQADVTVATYQTLSRSGMKRLDKFDPESFKAVIVDEAHHAVAKSYLAILARFDSRITSQTPSLSSAEAIPASPILPEGTGGGSVLPDQAQVCDPVHPTLGEDGKICVPIIGFTATFGRADGIALGKIFEVIAWHGDWLDMIRSKWLAPLSFVAVQLGVDLSAVEVSPVTGEFVQTSLARAVGKKDVVTASVEAWLEKAQKRRSTLVFAINVEHVLSLTNEFRKAGIDARFVYEGTPTKERVATLEAFRRTEFPVLVNCGILTEGADFPAIDTVLLARPTRSQNLYLQMIGRGLRNSPETEKENCLVMDMVGNSSAGIVCAPSLFGIDPDTVLDGKERSTQELEKIAVEAPIAPPALVTEELDLQYRHFETVFDLNNRVSANKVTPISQISENAWVGCGAGTYVLELLGNGYLKISKEPGEVLSDSHTYVAHRYNRVFGNLVNKTFAARHDNLRVLIRTVDAIVRNSNDLAGLDLRRRAHWRKAMSTEVQQALIAKKLAQSKDDHATTIDAVWVGRTPGKDIELVNLTKGDASDIICRLKNGGLGHWRKVQTARKKIEKKREKEEKKTRP